jgi:HAD superfamily hydrolase (TIGR01509 family)
MDQSRLLAVVFDLDGLLANTEDLYEQAGTTVLRRRGKTYDADLREKMMGRPAADALRIAIDCHTLSDPLDELLCECKTEVEALLATSLAAMPGVDILLEGLRTAHVPMAVATSGTEEFANLVLTRLDIGRYFQFVLTAESIHRGKPDPEMYLLAAERLHLEPRQMMVLEDSANGCRAAVAAGAFTVAVPNRHTHRHDFAGVRFVADSLADPRIRKSFLAWD